VKYLPIIAVSVLFSACATQPAASVQPVGTSAKAPADVAQCIAQKWADSTQQPVTSQVTIANNLGVDVLAPGQAPGGAAAVIRPAVRGPGSWVGYRAGGVADANVVSSINGCL
jgi:hypothetical protein